MLREGRKVGFRTVTVGGVVLGIFAVPDRRRLGRGELRIRPGAMERTKRTSTSPL